MLIDRNAPADGTSRLKSFLEAVERDEVAGEREQHRAGGGSVSLFETSSGGGGCPRMRRRAKEKAETAQVVSILRGFGSVCPFEQRRREPGVAAAQGKEIGRAHV